MGLGRATAAILMLFVTLNPLGSTQLASAGVGIQAGLAEARNSQKANQSKTTRDTAINYEIIEHCDPGILVKPSERAALFSKLRISNAGTRLLSSFTQQYHSLQNLIIQWSSSSYSQVAPAHPNKGRSLASATSTVHRNGRLGAGVCVYLARKLPMIEHIADLSHELTHATRLEEGTLKGVARNEEEFVEARLLGPGGEAEAFVTECRVKREILGRWDSFCSPYVRAGELDAEKVADDLYEGRLSASLTGEAYPVMLARQFRAIQARKKPSRSVAGGKYSGLENKEDIQ